jgi:hypothetical protein
LSEVLGIKTITDEALGIAKQLCAMHWGLPKKLGEALGIKDR